MVDYILRGLVGASRSGEAEISISDIFFFFISKGRRKMRTPLFAALLLSLVASIYSQQVPDSPTSDQLQCITDASTDQALDILSDCANADLSNVRSQLCTCTMCIIVMHNIFSPCSFQVSVIVGLASTAF